MVKIAVLLGADEENATRDAVDIVEFETRLAKVSE